MAVLLVFFTVLILHYSGILVPAESLAVRAMAPLGSVFYRLGQRAGFWRNQEIKKEDYDKLENERNQLVAQNIELQLLVQENEELREALNFIKENNYTTMTANVIGRDSASSGYFVIDKGSEDGVGENYAVISPDGMLVGKIIKTEAKVSLFMLPNDTNFQTAAIILGKSKRNTSGLVRGEKGLGVNMEFIPQDEPVERGDIVATSGLELDMPKGLAIGRVTEVQKEVRDVFSRATITPPLAYGDLDIVMVVLPQ